jgi:hypothetical protein
LQYPAEDPAGLRPWDLVDYLDRADALVRGDPLRHIAEHRVGVDRAGGRDDERLWDLAGLDVIDAITAASATSGWLTSSISSSAGKT